MAREIPKFEDQILIKLERIASSIGSIAHRSPVEDSRYWIEAGIKDNAEMAARWQAEEESQRAEQELNEMRKQNDELRFQRWILIASVAISALGVIVELITKIR